MELLLAEDSQELSEIMAQLFESLGYDVRIAQTGLDAISIIRENVPEVIVLDVHLPLASGFEVLDFLRHQEGGEHTRAIIFTGDVYAKNAPEINLADIVLDKPIDIQVLVDAVQGD